MGFNADKKGEKKHPRIEQFSQFYDKRKDTLNS